jgi:hypothetical protein
MRSVGPQQPGSSPRPITSPDTIRRLPLQATRPGLGAIPFLRYAVGPAIAQIKIHPISPAPAWRRGTGVGNRPGYLKTGAWCHPINCKKA